MNSSIVNPCRCLYLVTQWISTWGSTLSKGVPRSRVKRIGFTLSCIARVRVVGPLGELLGHGVASTIGGATSPTARKNQHNCQLTYISAEQRKFCEGQKKNHYLSPQKQCRTKIFIHANLVASWTLQRITLGVISIGAADLTWKLANRHANKLDDVWRDHLKSNDVCFSAWNLLFY
jgi:hypothetical protein